MISADKHNTLKINLILVVCATLSTDIIITMEKEIPYKITIENKTSGFIIAGAQYDFDNNHKAIKNDGKAILSVIPHKGKAYVQILLPNCKPSSIDLGIEKKDEQEPIIIKHRPDIVITRGRHKLSTAYSEKKS